jgi:hypothetical protein
MAPPPPPPSPDEPEPEWKSRARRDEKIAALIVGPLVALMVAAGVATGDDDVSGPKAEPTATPETLAVREGEILFQDDFSDSTSGWATGVSEEGEVGYVEGAIASSRRRGDRFSARSKVQGSKACVWSSRPHSSPARAETASGPAATPMSVRTWATSWESHRPSRAISSPHSAEMTSGCSSRRGRGSRPSGPRAVSGRRA